MCTAPRRARRRSSVSRPSLRRARRRWTRRNRRINRRDNRRMRGGQPAGSDAAKIGELQEALRRAQEELRNKPSGGGVDSGAADAAIALGDALAELRSSLRAASDEATVLTAPSQSVTVV